MDYFPLEDITHKERKGIIELRKRVENKMTLALLRDNTVFIRFLRARECNINKATEMLNDHIKWRKQNDVDNILESEDPELLRFLPSSLFAFDLSGHPIRYDDVGKYDLTGLMKSMKFDQLVRCYTKIFEMDVATLQTQSEHLGRPVDKWIHIMNFEHFSFASATNKRLLQFFVDIVSLYERNYPERLNAAYIINASTYFTMLYSITKPLLSSKTLNKIKIYGKGGWKEELLKIVDANDLPVFLGGNRTDESGDPVCSAFIKHGCPVPASYYLRSYERRLSSQPDIGKMVVTRMSKLDIELDVKNAGDFIEWQFETESGDISFGLFMEVDGQSMNPTLKEIIPTQRVEAHIAFETGTYRCEEPGKYIFQFDNTHSWLRRKEVYFRVEVVKYSK